MKPPPGLSSGVSLDTISLDCCGDWATPRSRQPRKYVTEYMKRPTKVHAPVLAAKVFELENFCGLRLLVPLAWKQLVVPSKVRPVRSLTGAAKKAVGLAALAVPG